MSRRDRDEPRRSAGSRALVFIATLSIVAALVAVGALAFTVTRGGDPSGCRTVAWNAIPETSALPAGWSMVSNRVFPDNLSTTLVGPTPSGSTQGPAVYVSLICYGNDAALAMTRSRDGALAAGATDFAFPSIGDASFAVQSIAAGSTAVYVRRGVLIANLTAPTSMDQSTLDGLARTVDAAMTRALSGTQPPSFAPGSPAASTEGSAAASPSGPAPSQSAVAESHVAPDLEAKLPHLVGSATLTTQSVLGTSVLQSDAASQALVASLTKLGKTPADLEIAQAHDASGSLQASVLAYRVKGATASDLGKALLASLLTDTSATPKSSQVTLASRPVTKVTFAQSPAVYLYEASGIVFAVQAADDSVASTVLALLK